MSRPRKHDPAAEAKAMQRVAAGESAAWVARDMGINPITLRSRIARSGGSITKAGKPETFSASRTETSEGTGINLAALVEQATRNLLEHADETRELIASNGDAAIIRLRLAWEGTTSRTILAAVAVGVPKLTVTDQQSVNGDRVSADLLAQVALIVGQGRGHEQGNSTMGQASGMGRLALEPAEGTASPGLPLPPRGTVADSGSGPGGEA